MTPDGQEPVIVRKQRGRPRVEDPLSSVSVRLPSRCHDRLIQVAKRHRCSVSEVVRRVLVLQLSRKAG